MELLKSTDNKSKRQYYKEKALERLGETRINNMGSKMWIIEYDNCDNITVEFKDGYTVKTRYQYFTKGSVSNPYDKTVFGIGYLGEGKYKTSIKGKVSKQYVVFHSMLERCYSLKYQHRQPTYKECKVCNQWLNFQNFAKWYDENYYEITGQRMELDKDILVKGNKIYSPITCVLVPKNINILFVKDNIQRGKLPIGVSYCGYINKKNSYYAQCRNGKEIIRLGYFNNPNDAFKAYKQCKEKVIADMAEQYKKEIPEKLYNAMISYEVDKED